MFDTGFLYILTCAVNAVVAASTDDNLSASAETCALLRATTTSVFASITPNFSLVAALYIQVAKYHVTIKYNKTKTITIKFTRKFIINKTNK